MLKLKPPKLKRGENFNIKYIKKIFIQAQTADSAPPLGTVLGNLGVNTTKFCDQFNGYTRNLPNYFLLNVVINVFENRKFTFFVFEPTTGSILNLLKFERSRFVKLKTGYEERTILCVRIRDIVQVALFKHPEMDLRTSLKITLGTVQSMKLNIVVD